jgi:glucosamine-6-phosphate deaminase
MDIIICENPGVLARHAAAKGAELIRAAIARRDAAYVILATGSSQIEMLAHLVAAEGIDWRKVTAFHLDEYIGLPLTHPASFRRYLKERVAGRVPIGCFHYIDGETDPEAECRRVGDLIAPVAIDVAFVGIGENGHLAFNDPPADFLTTRPYLVVELDEACRRQQMGEGWFPTLADVPRRAISMSVRQIMKSAAIVCAVADLRKARAVRDSLQGPVTANVPASILQQHPQAAIYLEPESASLCQN